MLVSARLPAQTSRWRALCWSALAFWVSTSRLAFASDDASEVVPSAVSGSVAPAGSAEPDARHKSAEPLPPPLPMLRLRTPVLDFRESEFFRETRGSNPTLRYWTAAEPDYVRALLEWETVFVLGFLWYLTAPGHDGDWTSNYSWELYRKKLIGHAFEVDRNQFSTNFIGHPLGGSAYYLAARANRASISESVAFAIGGSVLWEFFGEAGEVLSFNDSIVTPIAGVALGEAIMQLGAFFDRSADTKLNRVLARVFSPVKALNDALDGLEPRHSTTPFPPNEWHRFELYGGIRSVAERRREGEGPASPVEGQIRAAERIVRLPDYDAPGHRSAWFNEANLSSMELELAAGRSGVSDFLLDAEVVMVGHYFRHLPARTRFGGGGVIGLGVGFEYSAHDYQRLKAHTQDEISGVQPLSLVLDHRVSIGELGLHSHVSVGPSYAGVVALALPDFEGTPEVLPVITQNHGYYLGLGVRTNTFLRLSYRRVEATLETRADAYEAAGAPGQPVQATLRDQRLLHGLRIDYLVPESRVRLGVAARDRHRSSRAEDAFRSLGERSLGVQLGVVL